MINRNVTDKTATAYKDTGKGVAGIEAIKTILDTRFPKGGYLGGGVSGLQWGMGELLVGGQGSAFSARK